MLNPFPISRCFIAAAVMIFSLFSLNSLAATISAKTNQVLGEPVMQSLAFDRNIHRSKIGDTVLMPLAGHGVVAFSVSSRKTMTDGGTVISASSKLGTQLLLSSDEQAIYGSINGDGINFAVSTDSQLGTILVDRNHAEFPVIDLGDDGVIPPGVSLDTPGIEQITPQQKAMLSSQKHSLPQISGSGSTIRMLILYSNEFAAGFSSPTARINQLLLFTNQSMQNSNIDLEFTLARAQVLNFDNGLSISNTTLSQIQAGLGAFSGVADLRNEVGADMVAVLSFQTGFSASGIAYVNGSDPNFAFSYTRLSPGCCDVVFAHELGHNMGSGHESLSANPTRTAGCSAFNFTGYSCGHGNFSAGWGTVMSRSPLNRQAVNNVFSNPNITCLGAPCGIVEGQANAADNFRSFNISRLLVADFRPDPPPPPPGPTGNSDTEWLPSIFILLLDD